VTRSIHEDRRTAARTPRGIARLQAISAAAAWSMSVFRRPSRITWKTGRWYENDRPKSR
jgi:hypothetical protein